MKMDVHVKTGKKTGKVIKKDFGVYEVWVKSPPVKGAANKELITALANHFNVKTYNLRIIKGPASSLKIVELSE